MNELQVTTERVGRHHTITHFSARRRSWWVVFGPQWVHDDDGTLVDSMRRADCSSYEQARAEAIEAAQAWDLEIPIQDLIASETGMFDLIDPDELRPVPRSAAEWSADGF